MDEGPGDREPVARPVPVAPAFAQVLPRRLRAGQNLAHKLGLLRRFRSRPRAHHAAWRTLYRNIYPNKTCFHVHDEPIVAIRKFSPCGRYLVTFSRTPGAHSVQVYRLKRATRSTAELPELMWGHYFDLHFTTVVSDNSDVVNKDFCLFTAHAKSVLVASVQVSNHVPSVHERRAHPDALTNIQQLENYTFHLIEMSTGMVTATRQFPNDSINLAQNTGVYLFRNLLAVMSLRNQQIHLLQIRDDGSLLDLMVIGSYCYQDDELFLQRTAPEPAPGQVPTINPPQSLAEIMEQAPYVPTLKDGDPDHTFITGVKHRLLVFLYQRARSSKDWRREVRRFQYHFEEYRSLCMWKMQLLDERHILIKYGSVDQVCTRPIDSVGMLTFLVVYDFLDTRLVNVFENNDEAFLSKYEQWADYFQQAMFDRPVSMLSTPSNSLYCRQAFRKTLYAVRTARNGGSEQAIRRGLNSLPIAAQNNRESPYFDLSLFSYDEKRISQTDRLKHCTEFPAKFYSRVHGGVVFRVQAGLEEQPVVARAKKLASYTFHPFLPFAISVQHVIFANASTTSHINFHLRDDGE